MIFRRCCSRDSVLLIYHLPFNIIKSANLKGYICIWFLLISTYTSQFFLRSKLWHDFVRKLTSSCHPWAEIQLFRYEFGSPKSSILEKLKTNILSEFISILSVNLRAFVLLKHLTIHWAQKENKPTSSDVRI